MPRTTVSSNPQDLLPLSPSMFHILLVLNRGDRHGYAMIREVADDTEGAVRLGPGTLYYALHRMAERGLIAEAQQIADASSGGEQRRCYRITAFGRRVARAETNRLERALDVARQRLARAERG